MRTPEYVSTAYHEIEVAGGGVIRVEGGFIVTSDPDEGPAAYPPEVFAEEFPGVDVATLATGPGVPQPAEPEGVAPAADDPNIPVPDAPVPEPDAPTADPTLTPQPDPEPHQVLFAAPDAEQPVG